MKPFRSRAVKAFLLPPAFGLAAIGMWLSRTETPAFTAMPQAKVFAGAAVERRAWPVEAPPVEMPVAEAPAPEKPSAVLASSLSDLPRSEQESLQQAIFQAMHAVEPLTETEAALPQNEGVSHFVVHPGQKFNASFRRDGGVTLASSLPDKTWHGTLRLANQGSHSSWSADGTRAERTADGVTEWYENRADGLEHGFILSARPAGAQEHGFRLDLTLDGLQVEFDPGREGDLVLTDPETGDPLLAYRDLKVWDATGRELAATMQPTGPGLRFAVRDAGAVYPVTIDPLIASLEWRTHPDFQKITAPDPAQEGRFGHAVALAGDTAILGAPGNHAPGANAAGAAYVFIRSGDSWQFQQKLTASGGAAGDDFGRRLALSGNIAAISAPGDDAGGIDAGAVYLFERNGSTWIPWTKLMASNAEAGDGFGESVALNGDTLLVGAPGKNTDSGAAYLFTRNGTAWGQHAAFVGQSRFGAGVAVGEGIAMVMDRYRVTALSRTGSSWSEQDTLYPDDARRNIPLSSIAMKGDTALVGMPEYRDNDGPFNAGAVFVLQHMTVGSITRVRAKLTAPLARMDDFFGSAVAFDGGQALIGARGAPNGKRAAYCFTGSVSTWALACTFDAPEEGVADGFCHDLAIDGDLVVISANQDDEEAPHAGGAYFYKGPFIGPGDVYGISADIDGNVAVIGASGHNLPGLPMAGAAWVLRRSGTVWQVEQKLTHGIPFPEDRFGGSVGVSGNRIVVGAYLDDEDNKTDCGSATIFERGGGGLWQQRNRLGTDVAAAGDHFGHAVAIDGDTVAVGSPMKLGARGRVSVYTLGAGSSVQVQHLTQTATPGQARFGFSVAVSGHRLIVGSPRWDQGAFRTGRVFFYKREAGSWVDDGGRGPSGSAALDYRAGISVALDGDVAVVGCGGPASMTGGGSDTGRAGRAFVLTYNGSSWADNPVWLDGSGYASDEWFGRSVAVEGDVIAVGAFGDASGGVRLFQREGAAWLFQNDLTAPTPDDVAANRYGASAALSGDTLLMGAYGVNSSAGRVYIYRVGGPWLKIRRSSGNMVLTWPAGTGMVLWRSLTMANGSWNIVPGTTDATTYSFPISSAPQMFFRLAPP